MDRARTVHRHVLYLGERSDTQHRSWQKAIGVFDESTGAEHRMVLFPTYVPTLYSVQASSCVTALIEMIETYCKMGQSPISEWPSANSAATGPVEMGPAYGVLAGLHALARELDRRVATWD